MFWDNRSGSKRDLKTVDGGKAKDKELRKELDILAEKLKNEY